MTYDEKIPEFALQPAKAADEEPKPVQEDDGFDPTPYDRLLAPAKKEEKPEAQSQEREAEEVETKAAKEADEEVIAPVIFEPEEADSETMVPVAEPLKITPLSGQVVYNDLKITTASQTVETKIFVEEDILVPDIKPDLISILSMDGKAFLSSKEIQIGQDDDGKIKVTGEVLLQTIYLPDGKEAESVSIISSRLPFKTDWQVTASPLSHLVIEPHIERIDYSVVNERKFRAKITLGLCLREFAEKELQLFENLRGEKLEMLKETVQISHVAQRKEDSVEISEEMKLREGSPKPVRILKSDICVIENHKQITSEKMVINASIRVSVLYIGEEEKDGETKEKVAFFQGKTDFTQFILMNKEDGPAMSRVAFDDKELEVKISEEEEGFTLEGTVTTSVQIYRNMEREVVCDLYHAAKDMTYDASERQVEAILGTGTTEVSAREIIDIPEKKRNAGKGPLCQRAHKRAGCKSRKWTGDGGRHTGRDYPMSI